MTRRLLVGVALLATLTLGCGKSPTAPATSTSVQANVIITARFPNYDGSLSIFNLKNTGSGNAYWVTVDGYAPDPSWMAPEGTATVTTPAGGAGHVSWSDTP